MVHPLVLMVNVDRKYYIVSFEHPDSTNIPVDFLNLIFKSTGTKLIFDRKKLKYHVNEIKNSHDAMVCSYLSSKLEIDNNYLVIYTVSYRIIKMEIQTAKKYLNKSVGIWLKKRVLKV